MKIAVLSDSHDNVWKIREAMPYLRDSKAVIHCGDMCAPFVIKELAGPLEDIPIHIVWGNNDGDTYRISKVAAGFPHVNLHAELAEISIADLWIAVNHYPKIARALALTGEYDMVFYGHDHTAHDSMIGECLLLNPGELMGLNGVSSLVIVDTETKQFERIFL
ncbi:MAG: YfcE family phosphodiesterase [Anaerolineales bacterium]|nr:YfcE family phosphodiesterase [Anaerolineales bacterium]